MPPAETSTKYDAGPPVAAPLGDPDAQDNAIEQWHSNHLAAQREMLEAHADHPAALANIRSAIAASERALRQAAIRRRQRDTGRL
jgi:hypothetical protein